MGPRSNSSRSARLRSSLPWTARELRAWFAATPAFPGSLVNPVALQRSTRPDPVVRTRGSEPVVLVHGYLGNAATWAPLVRRLEAGGQCDLWQFCYSSYGIDLPRLGERLREQIRAMLLGAPIGTGPVHLVGHSLGGLVVRWALLDPDFARLVTSATTIVTPHGGAGLAPLCPGSLGREMRPGSATLRRLARSRLDPDVRWTAYYSDADQLVCPQSAMLPTPCGIAVENLLLPGLGHLSVLGSEALAVGLEQRLPRPDQVAVSARAA